MELLVGISVFAAFCFSIQELFSGGTRVYFDSMSIIIAFVLLGKIIEARAKFSAKESLLRLSRSTPQRGRKRFEEEIQKSNTAVSRFVLVKEINVGDVVITYTGERVVLDGVVVEGMGACDESLMTGEAIPVAKGEGSPVLAGTILVQGSIAYRVTSDAEQTALHKIIEMVEGDIGHKSLYVRSADKIVRWFVPVVITLAFISGLAYWTFPNSEDLFPLETAWLRVLSVLLISCPCAIGIAAPVAESYLLNGLAALGAIVRNRGCLAHLGKESVFVFDKTGTVTEGRFALHCRLDFLNERDKSALYSLARHSLHPVAVGIAAGLAGDCRLLPVEKVEEMPGYGMQGIVDNCRYSLGSARFMQLQGISVLSGSQRTVDEEPLSTHAYLARDGICLGRLSLSDKVRKEMKELLISLKPVPAILLSGDAEAVVQSVAKLCGFDEWHALRSPLEKREFIDTKRKEGKVVCMIGDGINDAPALTAANVGISVVSATDMSIQVSDILLTTDKLSTLLKIRQLAKKGEKIIRQNLFWAFFYNVIGIFLAMFGWLSPIFAAFAMSVSSITVLFNAQRVAPSPDFSPQRTLRVTEKNEKDEKILAYETNE